MFQVHQPTEDPNVAGYLIEATAPMALVAFYRFRAGARRFEMNQPRKFEITCTTTWRSVVLETCDWWSEMGENVEAIHYRAKCTCGKEHVGCSLPIVKQS
jgi:hypothetical protein